MSNRDVRWLQRRTNITDLLDDGIENYSDLKPGASAAGAADAEGTTVAESPGATASPRSAASTPTTASPRPTVAWFGLLLGIAFVAAGVRLFLAPVDLMVYHQRMKRPSFVEHVTPQRSRIYGTAAAVVGLGLLGFSLYRPRQ